MKCNNKDCWKVKNHAGCAALPVLVAAAAAGGDVPGTYGKTRKVKANGDVDAEGYQNVGGHYVEGAPPAPPPYVKPAPFAEEEDEEE